MTTHQVVFLLLDLALVIVLARLLGVAARRIGQPPVIGEVLAGVLLGPSLLGEGFTAALFPVDVRPFLAVPANIGVAVFMFVIGLELQRSQARGQGGLAATVSISSILLPFALGVALAFRLIANHPVEDRVGFTLFMGAAMSVTAFPVLARILADRGMLRTALGGLALTCAAIDDVLAWTLLAVVVLLSGSGGPGMWLLLLCPVYVAVMFGAVRPLVGGLLGRGAELTGTKLALVVAGVLVSAAFTEWVGLHFVFGAFLFGVVVPREGTEALRAALVDRVAEFNGALLLPVFFIVAGLKVNLSTIGWTGVLELGLVLLAAIGGKFGGAFAAARAHGVPARRSAALATLMNTRGLTELIILSVGLELGVLDRGLYSIMVVMAVVTTAMAGPLLNLVYPRGLVERDRREAVERSGVGAG
ncbi:MULTISPECIES: cation:proton antiporter [Actinosynnema]|uniref:cation:proton antiporter domain-containing protein n=1 Tax=Actinosynnema TaxID=40566 RepID=UPI0020A518BC|nr:cation:proton antiporter [Actinosynnema pretiosum]MCP2094529.1 Kef-type K+ transport system, membrane component KefB [Actinosynnema pretiosum]